MKKTVLTVCLLALVSLAGAMELYVSPTGGEKSEGTLKDPLTFESALAIASQELITNGLPTDGITINVVGGKYRYKDGFTLGEEFKGTADNPIVIKAYGNEAVQFDGSVLVPANKFKKVSKKDEMARLSQSAVDKVVVTTIKDKAMIARFNQSLMLNITIDGTNFLPSVFPNEGYAYLKEETVKAEVSAPAVPVGKEHHGVRAGFVPYEVEGKERGWKGDLNEPRGAHAQFGTREDEMAGTWAQWEAELKRNNTRNQLTGFIEASWLLSSQDIYGASAKTNSVQLTRALGYGWAWRKNDKPFRVFGMLCELDSPGEWYFDIKTNRLFVYPPDGFNDNTEVSLSVAEGFMTLDQTQYVNIIGISATCVGGGIVYSMNGENNLLAGATISNCTARGAVLSGSNNSVISCDFYDLNMHALLSGGKADGEAIVEAQNKIENCHFYQKQFTHEKINILMTGCGNIFRGNLLHNSIGQAMIVNGNEQLVELNELFNIGFEEGDGGAIYSGNDIGGFGNVYRYNFFHHMIHCPGKVSRAGIHLDDGQSGATLYGNIFYKSASKGIFAFGGAGHTFYDNVLLEGDRGIYFCRALGEKMFKIEKEIRQDPTHHRVGTKEDYVGRVEKRIGVNGWAKSPWLEAYPEFNKIMSDTTMYGRLWPIRYKIHNNYAYGNNNNKIADYRICEEVLAQDFVEEYKQVLPTDFINYDALNLAFKPSNHSPSIPFAEIGLKVDQYRAAVPNKSVYRKGVKDFYNGVKSYKGTKDQIDTSELVNSSIEISEK